jgi:halimadienyl-diphosphate synthase
MNELTVDFKFSSFIPNYQMKDQIKYLIEKLGQGLCGPVAYDTAIVACIPCLRDFAKPAFPEALQWIRSHQLADGSWGTDSPVYFHGNTLSTLAAIIALKKWNNKNDSQRIKRGEEALQELAQKIKSETHESIGYELLLPSLLKKAMEYELKIAFENFDYSEKFREKFESIKCYHKKYGLKKKHTFWFSLEMVDGLSNESNENLFELDECMLDMNGSVSASPSATAFFLTTMRVEKGVDSEKAYNYLENLIRVHKGGIPPLSPSDTFELSFCSAALLMSGFQSNHELLESAIDRLHEKWLEFDGLLGCSSYLPPDSDAIAMSLYVLHSTGRITETDSVNKLLKFFNGSYLYCFIGERNPSISVNINGLIALRLFDKSSNIKKVITKIVNWLESQTYPSNKGFIFEDKWHISPYYCISRAVFAFRGINDNFAQKCVDQLISHQKSDGGWGLGHESTLEETAHVCLALCHWFRFNVKERNKNNLKILERIDYFFRTFSGKIYVELWIAKTLYCPTTVVEAFVIAAKYSLRNTIEFLNF